MKTFIKYTFLFLVTMLSLTSCRDGEEDNLYSDIKIGKEQQSLTEVKLNKETIRNIILSGGNGKYAVNIEDSKVARVEISHDTLKIRGLFEGSTFATITSHNKKARLNINVIPPDISISHDFVRLYPKDDTKFISLSGGGDIVDLVVNDPENIINVKWNGATNILEIKAFHEGEATITAKSANSPDRVLKVKVRADGEVKDVGVYSTTSRSVYPLLTSKMVVKRKGVGVWISSTSRPYGVAEAFYERNAMRVTPIINPKVGEKVSFEARFYPYINSIGSLKEGKNELIVEEVRENTVVLRGRGIRVVLPYEN